MLHLLAAQDSQQPAVVYSCRRQYDRQQFHDLANQGVDSFHIAVAKIGTTLWA